MTIVQTSPLYNINSPMIILIDVCSKSWIKEKRGKKTLATPVESVCF